MNRVKSDIYCKVRAYLDSLVIDLKNKKICVCLSGGADSVALLHTMIDLSSEYGFEVCACHFNHMIRGEEADRDETFCKNLCKELSLKLYCGRDDVPANARYYKISLEEAARNCRYDYFERICNRYSIDFCVTAHNMNDDAETLLFNLIRGSGINGASSISPVKGNVLRPFLRDKRKDIENYLEEIRQTHITDSTNSSIEYTRNFIRKEIIPKIESINPSVIDALARYIDSARIDKDYFNTILKDYYEADLNTLHKAIRIRVLVDKFKRAFGQSLNSFMITELENALQSHRRSIVSLNDEYEAVVFGGKVDFYKKSDNVNFECDAEKLVMGSETYFGKRVTISCSDMQCDASQNVYKISTTNKISFDNICGELCVRTRKVGDKICIHGINKSLKKLFIDKKIPKEYRNLIPIIFDDEGILYVPFIGISDRAFCKSFDSGTYITTYLNTVDIERWKNAYE